MYELLVALEQKIDEGDTDFIASMPENSERKEDEVSNDREDDAYIALREMVEDLAFTVPSCRGRRRKRTWQVSGALSWSNSTKHFHRDVQGGSR